MITWTHLATEETCDPDFRFRGPNNRQNYTCEVHIELSNGVRDVGIGHAWSWGFSAEAEAAARRRAWANLYKEVLPRLSKCYGRLRQE